MDKTPINFTMTDSTSTKGSANLRSLIYDPSAPSLQVLDQLLLPHQKVYLHIRNVSDAWKVIRSMQIRGAPLIAIVACLGLVVDLHSNETKQAMEACADAAALAEYLQTKLDYLATSRPTAVNLFHALKSIGEIVKKETEETTKNSTKLQTRLVNAIQQFAQIHIYLRDERDNISIGNHGANAILLAAEQPHQLRVMTICNTGSLATGNYGTALGVVRTLNNRQRLLQIVALETRPYNQGSRLTAFELQEDQLPGLLICDNMAGYYMAQHKVDAVVVGADRVCANGDVTNKIGTYTLALLATAHGVPFYVAAPLTTLDASLESGANVEIEERPAVELIRSSQAPEHMPVWNPGFDVTPAKYIHGIITEKGVIVKNAAGKFDVAGFIRKHAD
ncbi:hypothetical protein MPSEU_000830200 [Mayamaea pseudoterrestris]|nr:hypothetical protein MPSEU_000830200 [Mayamaea pseudoterrestris]